ncbi:hypothetical protein TorRG33x02_118970 [Trema orientale]|uniref:Uncharacterized protein n=1 Tax=Trema orientale TaxID=63057 RepID=A0A2P5F3B1_TREOI|nr:hypothetical protein TorRG33x02_118970 [Trema orientale]
MATSRMTTRSTRPETEERPQEVPPSMEKKLDRMLAALTEANRKAEMAHDAVRSLREEVAEVRRDNVRLEGLLASEARSEQRGDDDGEDQQEAERHYAPAREETSTREEQQSRTRPPLPEAESGRQRLEG